MNPNTTKNPVVIGLAVTTAILLVIIIVLATRNKADAPAVATDQTTETPALDTATTKKVRTAPKVTTTTDEKGTTTATSGATTEEADAYATLVVKTDAGKYMASFDYIDWQYNADLAMSAVVNKDPKIRTFELDKNIEISYVNEVRYAETLDRREIFMDIVESRKGGLYHIVIKDGKVTSAVEIYRP